MHTLFLREHFSGEIARKCMVCYTKRVHLYGCLYRFMSPIKCRCRSNSLCISIVHCQPPTGNEKEREVLPIVYAFHYVYHCRRFWLLNACNVERNTLKKVKESDLSKVSREGKDLITRVERESREFSREIINNWFDV